MPKVRGSGSSQKNSGDGGNNELETPLNVGVNNELEKPLKKGTWTPEEDKILIDYVNRHGAGNWNAVQKNSGLSRCGKSCRLRWVNHLRPELRKDKFTPEEEEHLIELHHRLGNKWSCMAAEMPGRTDNEIKNFWNTRLKRVNRTGGEVYPVEICQKAEEAKQRGDNIDALASDNVQSQRAMWSDGSMDIPEITFERMDYTAMSEGNFPDSLGMILKLLPSCRFQSEPQSLPSSSHHYITTNNDPRNMMEGANLSDIVNMDLVVNSHVHNPDLLAEFNALIDSHLPGNEFNALLDSHVPGNATCFPSSTPFTHGDGKLELPSIQHVDDAQGAELSNADNQMPPLESEDTLMTGQIPSYGSPSMNNQLLESVLYQSHILSDEQSLGQEIDMLLQPSSSAGNNMTVRSAHGIISADRITQLAGEDSGIESFLGLHQLDEDHCLGPFVS